MPEIDEYKESLDNPTPDDAQRVLRAILVGYTGFGPARHATSEGGRHFLWIYEDGQWVSYKASGSRKDWFKALLDEANIPE